MHGFFAIGLMTAVLLSAANPPAKTETQAISSPKCDQKKLRAMAGNAAVKVEAGSWEGSYNVTLDTAKMTFDELLKKLVKEKCF